MSRVDDLKEYYELVKHPEGGYFSDVYTAPYLDKNNREVGGSIYFLLNEEDISHFHQIDVDEIWYYHEGSPMRIYMIDEEGYLSYEDLGPVLSANQHMMVVIPRGYIFAAENLDKTSYSFVSCATMPQFKYEGFRLVGKKEIQSIIKSEEDIERLIMDDETINNTEIK